MTPFSDEFSKIGYCLASSLALSIKKVIKKLTLFLYTQTLMMSLPQCQHSKHIDSWYNLPQTSFTF